jgi:hypothetical protein
LPVTEAVPVRLKALLLDRHWQKYSTFCREYQKAARSVDSALARTYPSRAQLHRWMSGQVKGSPYPDACRVLEAMFPGWSVRQLMEPYEGDDETAAPASGAAHDQVNRTLEVVSQRIASPASAVIWRQDPTLSARTTAGELLPIDSGTKRGSFDAAAVVSNSLLAMAKVQRLSERETEQLAGLAGNVVELELHLDIDIAHDGWATLTYRHELFNMSDEPVTRLSREVWFENTDGPVCIKPVDVGDRRLGIQRLHNTAHSTKFACQIAPALQPGETATISYICSGGQFVSEHYWRQSIGRYTRHFTLTLRHRGGQQLVTCSATEEHANGAENTVSEDLLWNYEDDDVLITFTRDYLRPNQAVTVRWELDR